MTLQLEKVYDPKNEEDDMREMEEERLRMREHVMKNVRGARAWSRVGAKGRGPSSVAYPSLAPQVDTNQDRLVTLEEFLVSTQRKDFGDTAEGWEVRTCLSQPQAAALRHWAPLLVSVPPTQPLCPPLSVSMPLPVPLAPAARPASQPPSPPRAEPSNRGGRRGGPANGSSPHPVRRRWRCTLPTRRRS